MAVSDPTKILDQSGKERTPRNIRVYLEEANWIYKERQINGREKETMADALERIIIELQGLRENEMKRRFED